VVQLSSLCEVIHTLPLLHALRGAHPEAEIGWVVEEGLDALIQGHPELTRLHVVPRMAWRDLSFFRRIWAVWSFNRELASYEYTVTIDSQSVARSAYLASRSRARLRIGYAPPGGRDPGRWFHTIRVTPSPQRQHIAERNLSLLRPLGIRDAEPTYVFPDYAEEKRDLAPFLEKAGDGFCAVHPGSSWPSKQWPVDHFTALAKRVVAEHGMKVVLVGGSDVERSRAELVAREVGDGALVAPDPDVRRLAALLSRARLFVGGDTGPMHVASAQGIPTVAIFGPTRGENTGPMEARSRWIDAGLGCSGCGRRRCPDGAQACMRSVLPEDVMELVDEVLK
jgi:lipopolysaccharide heptosyltransferase I